MLVNSLLSKMWNYAFGLLLVLPSIALSIHLKGIDKAETKEMSPHHVPSAKNPDIGGGFFMASGSFAVPGIAKPGSLRAQNQPPLPGATSFNNNLLPSIGKFGPNIGPSGTFHGGSELSAPSPNMMGAPQSVHKMSNFGEGLHGNPPGKFPLQPHANSASEIGIGKPLPNTGVIPSGLNSPLNAPRSNNLTNLQMNNKLNISNATILHQNNTTSTTTLPPVSTVKPILRSSTIGPPIYNPAMTTVSMTQSFGHPANQNNFGGTGELPFAGPPIGFGGPGELQFSSPPTGFGGPGELPFASPPAGFGGPGEQPFANPQAGFGAPGELPFARPPAGFVNQEPKEPSSGPEHEFEPSAAMPNMRPQSIMNSLLHNTGMPPGRSSFMPSMQSNSAPLGLGHGPQTRPAPGTVAAQHFGKGNKLGAANEPSMFKPDNNLSNTRPKGSPASRNPTGRSSAVRPSSGTKAGASMTHRQTTAKTTKQQLGCYQPSTAQTTTPATSTVTTRRTTRPPTTTPRKTTRRATTSRPPPTTTQHPPTTSMSLWDFLFAPTTTNPMYAALLQHFIFQQPQPQIHHFGMPFPSDCDCNRKHDSCPPGKYPVGECHDGITCCDYW